MSGANASRQADQEVTLRIVVLDPPAGVTFAVQRGRGELVAPKLTGEAAIHFEVPVRARGDGDPNFLGPFVQGPRGGRFIYVNSGTLAGQAESCWTRRAKVPLGAISSSLVAQANAGEGRVLEACIAGRAGDGGPACATVPLLDGGWRLTLREGATNRNGEHD